MDGGDPRLEALLRERQWLAGLARRLVSDGAAAEDLAQETWLAAFARAPAEVRSWRAWLGESARRLASRERRGAGRRVAREAAVARPEATPSSDELVAKGERLELVAREARALDEPFRTVLLLRYQEELEPAAIAARLDLPADTVRARLRRALELLRARLERRLGPEWRAHVLFALPLSFQPHPTPAAGPGALTMAAVGSVAMAKWIAVVLVAGLGAFWWLSPERPLRQETEVEAEGLASAQPLVAPESVEERERSWPAASGAQRDEVPASPSERPALTAGGAELSGRVVGEEGAPLVGVQVDWIVGGDWQPGTTSDADGRFALFLDAPESVRALRLEPDDFHEERLVRFGGVNSDWPELTAGAHDLGMFTLATTGAVDVLVLDEHGAPVERAWTMMESHDDTSNDSLWGAWAWTDGQGTARIGGVSAGKRAVSAHHLGHLVPHVPVDVRVREVATVTVQLEEGPLYAGRVTDELGQGLADVELDPCGYYFGWKVKSAADGSFAVRSGWTDPCILSAALEGYEHVRGLGVAYPPGTRDIEIVLRPAQRSRILVLDPERRPVEDFSVLVEGDHAQSTGRRTETHHPGGLLEVAADRGVVVRIQARGFLDDFVILDEEETTQTLVLERGSELRGRVLQHGRPVAGATVRVVDRIYHREAADPGDERLWLNRHTSMEALEVALDPDPTPRTAALFDTRLAHTDEAGRFALAGFELDTVALEIRAPDGSGLFVERELTSSASDLGDLELEVPARLVGRVEFSLGASPLGAYVSVPGIRNESAQVDAEGRFTVDGVLSGPRWIEVTPPSSCMALRTAFFLRLAPGATREVLLRVEERPDALLALELRENGNPYAGPFGLRLAGTAAGAVAVELLNLRTDASGRQEVQVPADGAVWVEVSLEGTWVRALRPVDLGVGDQELVFDLATGTLVLPFPADFEPVEGEVVALHLEPEGAPASTLMLSVAGGNLLDVRREALGNVVAREFRIERLPAGTVAFRLEQAGLALGAGSVRIEAGTDVGGHW